MRSSESGASFPRSRTICRDWRDAPSEQATTLVAAEVKAWRDELSWDVRSAWNVVEPARRAGQLPGFLLSRSADADCGWTAFLRHRDTLQVMALVSRTADDTAVLADAVLASREAEDCDSVLVCVRDAAAGLPHVLIDRGFAVEVYRYLTIDLAAGHPRSADLRVWHNDEEAVARLCQRAYADSMSLRAFARTGHLEDWREYVNGLVRGPGCGEFDIDASFVSGPVRSQALRGAVLITTIAPRIAHVAQMVVEPEWRGRGLGSRLMRSAMGAAAARGSERMTLLVAAGNSAAVAIYERLGFTDRATFVVAHRDQPRVSTSFALATGGESTRR